VRLKILRFRACGSEFFPCGSGCGSTAEPLPIPSHRGPFQDSMNFVCPKKAKFGCAWGLNVIQFVHSFSDSFFLEIFNKAGQVFYLFN